MAKFDGGKPELSLIYSSFKEAIAKVRMLGVKKYGHREDWRSVKRVRYYDAAFRHLDQALKAEIEGAGSMIDEESGESHLAHAACCLMFLIEQPEQQAILLCTHCDGTLDEEGICRICGLEGQDESSSN